ncbi:TPA: hypothetical protein N2N40_002549 [Citrobacter freundii]|nr:hypothetical protein [Citrobacter freundii]
MPASIVPEKGRVKMGVMGSRALFAQKGLHIIKTSQDTMGLKEKNILSHLLGWFVVVVTVLVEQT